eukprot:TRINITY_DN7668_c0_g2_i1.p1 TRINITY_DN7668_c0_g2~~TRINITY_DN7668_c0_g2_i1.p1  ORF type:complete len:569 (-),score=171.75 TRINITY_DN7668_c0_g2_i1:60-1727(-)
MRQEDFNVSVVFVCIAAVFAYWYRDDIYKWILARVQDFQTGTAKRDAEVRQKKVTAEEDIEERKNGKASRNQGRHGGFRKRGTAREARALAVLKELDPKQLLEALSSDSDEPVVEQPEVSPVADLDQGRQVSEGHNGEAGDPAMLVTKSAEISLLHDVKPDKAPRGVPEALSSLSSSLFGVNLWDVVTKKSRLRVTGCMRWTGSSWEALGLVLYRIQMQSLQILYIGVAPQHRRQHVGRSLVKTLREAARRDSLCADIFAILPSGVSEEVVSFLKASGFKRSDTKGLEQGQVCLRLEVKSLGKRQRRQMERSGASLGEGITALPAWDELLAEAKSAARSGTTPTPLRAEKVQKVQETGRVWRLPPPASKPRTAAATPLIDSPAQVQEELPAVDVQEVEEDEHADWHKVEAPEDDFREGAKDEAEARVEEADVKDGEVVTEEDADLDQEQDAEGEEEMEAEQELEEEEEEEEEEENDEEVNQRLTLAEEELERAEERLSEIISPGSAKKAMPKRPAAATVKGGVSKGQLSMDWMPTLRHLQPPEAKLPPQAPLRRR